MIFAKKEYIRITLSDPANMYTYTDITTWQGARRLWGGGQGGGSICVYTSLFRFSYFEISFDKYLFISYYVLFMLYCIKRRNTYMQIT